MPATPVKVASTLLTRPVQVNAANVYGIPWALIGFLRSIMYAVHHVEVQMWRI